MLHPSTAVLFAIETKDNILEGYHRREFYQGPIASAALASFDAKAMMVAAMAVQLFTAAPMTPAHLQSQPFM